MTVKDIKAISISCLQRINLQSKTIPSFYANRAKVKEKKKLVLTPKILRKVYSGTHGTAEDKPSSSDGRAKEVERPPAGIIYLDGTHLTESDESLPNLHAGLPLGLKRGQRISIIDHKFKKQSDSSIATDTSSSITSLPGDDSATLYPGQNDSAYLYLLLDAI